MLLKQKNPSHPRNLVLGTFGELLSVLDKGKSAIPPLFSGPEVLSSASDKAKLFAENFPKNSYLDDSGTSLPIFPCRTNLNLYISITPKIVKKVIVNLDSSKASGPDCILVLVLKNCEADLSYILAELFNCVWKGSRTVVPEENRPPDNCLRTTAPWMTASQTIVLEDNCP